MRKMRKKNVRQDFFGGWQKPRLAQCSQPQPQPDFPALRFRAMETATAASTASKTRPTAREARFSCTQTIPHPPYAPAGAAAGIRSARPGRSSRYRRPASTRTASTVNALKVSSPVTRPPS